MAEERYTQPLALERMSEGRCPECGDLPGQHINHNAFWAGPIDCFLREDGVRNRIDQYLSDLASGPDEDLTPAYTDTLIETALPDEEPGV